MFQQKNYNYRNGSDVSKITCRKSFLQELANIDVTDVRYVGLPALHPVIETTISNEYIHSTLFLAEVNQEIYIKQKECIFYDFHKCTTYIHINDNVLACVVPFRINAIWLDLCSMLCKTLMNNIFSFIRGNEWDDEGVFAITLMASRERKEHRMFYNELEKQYALSPATSLQEFRVQYLPMIFCKMLSEATGKKTTITDVLCYNSNKNKHGGVNMCYYSFKW